MDSPKNNAVEGDVIVAESDEQFRLRPYQVEMVEESLKSNIIVVMDTGSGKTHIAIDRTRAELETCKLDKLVWFLAPTVTLCEQQYEVFESYLPGYGIQLLSGKDGIDHWTKQSVWDAVLHNIRICVSTHQVLLDALTHGFVKMSKLALLIFDEAHHCTRNHPAHNIMAFYGRGSDSTPKILGLSASPVMKANATTRELQQIEQNLRAIAKTPKVHRSDLVRYVHRPELVQIIYKVDSLNNEPSHLFHALETAHSSYDLMRDPYVVNLLERQQNGDDVMKPLQRVLVSRKTYCSEQLKTLTAKARSLATELGTSAMEWYLIQCITQFKGAVKTSDQDLFDWSSSEKQHLSYILDALPFPRPEPPPSMILSNLSLKVETLVNILTSEFEKNSEFTGLVFVEQRIWVAVLAEILSVHLRTKNLFRIGTYLGTSQSSKRKVSIANLPEPKNQQTTLDDFRAGKKNLILATSVLEEGIDVSNCHLVICFESPKNLKSFVQRRGRARKQESKYFIFTPDSEVVKSSASWQSLENSMREAYENDKRHVKEAEDREAESEFGERYLEVPTTGALLTLNNALPHLNHFCSSLGLGAYVNSLAEFEFFDALPGRIKAKVTLPISIDLALRSACSLESWRTERLAKKDAAFEAYKALYHAGLVNDNLLPLRNEANEQAAKAQLPDFRPSMVDVLSTFDPWQSIAQYQRNNPHVWYRTLLEVSISEADTIQMILLTPGVMPEIPDILLYWNESKEYTIKSSWIAGTTLSHEELQLLRSITERILLSVFHKKWDGNDYLWLLAPYISTELSDWYSSVEGKQPALELVAKGQSVIMNWGLVTYEGYQYIPNALVLEEGHSMTSLEETQLQMLRLPKRRDFLHPIPDNQNINEAYTRIENIPAIDCIVSNLPASYSIFALLFPSILYKFEVIMVAESLRTTILKPISFGLEDLPILVTAITASATGKENNYEKLEFLGDAILKFITSTHLMASNLNWPERYLTETKGRIVGNAFLSRAALASGLDQYILTKRFTGAKWKARCVTDVLTDKAPTQKEHKSSKMVADVIESLIGTAYWIGGIPKAFACVETLLSLEKWTPIPQAIQILHEAAPTQCAISSFHIPEELVGYTFEKKMLLLEALTHASYTGPNAHRSYERLEFLGDAVLDYIITNRVFKKNFSHERMHLLRSSIVNASILAYSMMELTVTEETTNKLTMQPELQHRALWQFLRSGHHQLVSARDVALKQHMAVRGQIATALEYDAKFPWHLFALIDVPKFLSDIVESVIGAIYIDSRGSIPACEVFIRRLGIFRCIDRIMRDNVDVTHPKVRLGILAVEKTVKYVGVALDHSDETSPSKMYGCQVMIGDEKVGGVVAGLKKLSAETLAAWQAVAILDRERDSVMKDFDDEDVFFDAEEGGGIMMEG